MDRHDKSLEDTLWSLTEKIDNIRRYYSDTPIILMKGVPLMCAVDTLIEKVLKDLVIDDC